MSGAAEQIEQGSSQRMIGAERTKAFTDAVVAIAMTLLILPLLESISEASAHEVSVVTWAGEHLGQISTFALSFLLIATFWTNHHAILEPVARLTQGLLWLDVAWMFMIVWMPVTTAMSGSAMAADRGKFVAYVLPMLGAAALAAVMARTVRRSPELWAEGEHPTVHPQAVALSMTILYGLAFAVGLALPGGSGFLAMFLLGGIAPLERVIARRLPA